MSTDHYISTKAYHNVIHFEPNSPTKTLGKLLKALKRGDLGIPLAHSYFQRKISNNTQFHHQPTDSSKANNLEQQNTFEEVVKDNPEFVMAILSKPKNN
ncbi:hypothetical protein DAPPUDRAFT_321011 [Daphnia pulex]|uniref:Uncharacterized protein n=1 Tax=Daphnia pulex TaxID=6669 RepID=E9GRP2_DAPPU|nr:hypothetical protein DAPPUDRAFT_321011 [Daphnia pulex]|eukprot:EFX77803.1 hypothetical protein DAPPUDRAFT_321011 [Daphnia pulex]